MGRHPNEIALGLESLRLWQQMQERVGADIGFRQSGSMWACDTDRELAELEAWLDHARTWQINTQLLDSATTASVLTGSQRRFAGALYTPTDAVAEPEKAVPAMARAARREGARVLGNCAVRGLELQAGRVAGVVTERGTIACQAVVLAGGAWSRLFCGNLGVELPQLKLLSSVLRTTPVPGMPDCALGASNFSMRRRQDGGFTVARRNASVAQIVPDSFRLFQEFLPTLRTSWRELRLRIGPPLPGRTALEAPLGARRDHPPSNRCASSTRRHRAACCRRGWAICGTPSRPLPRHRWPNAGPG